MDRFTRDDLKRLTTIDAEAAVSLYMPTYRAGREVRQNAIRFKNLAKRVDEQLAKRGVAEKSREALAAKLAELEQNDRWWQHQSDALALFHTGSALETYRLPLDLDELAVVGPRLHLRPMVRLLQTDGPFYLLAVSQNRVRLFSGTQYSISELDVDALPSDLRSALDIDEYMRSLEQHTGSYADDAGTPLLFHGHGGSGMEVQKKDEIKQFCHRIDDALNSYFGQEKIPLVFAGVDYLFPLFREASSYNNLVKEPVEGNPDDLTPEQLHPKAWNVVEPRFEKARQEAIQRYGDASGSDRSAAKLPQILRAARQGAVDTLILAEGEQYWGKVDQEKWTIEDASRDDADAEELLNFAAVHTLANGGEVFSASRHAMPNGQTAAAILRFALPPG